MLFSLIQISWGYIYIAGIGDPAVNNSHLYEKRIGGLISDPIHVLATPPPPSLVLSSALSSPQLSHFNLSALSRHVWQRQYHPPKREYSVKRNCMAVLRLLQCSCLVVRVINKYFLCPVPTYVPIQFSLQVFWFLGWGICSEQHYDEQGPLRLHQSNSYKRLVCPSVRPSVSL